MCRFLVASFFVLATSFQAMDSYAKTIKICVVDTPIPPFSFPDREGQAQRVVRIAIEKQGWQAEFQVVPVNRCRAGLKFGEFDATAVFPVTATNREVAVFPSKGAAVDSAMALGIAKAFAYRRVGSQANWDGHAFNGVKSPILFPLGISAIEAKLATLKIPYSDSAKTMPQIFNMLILKRADIVVGKEYEAEEVAQTDEFRDKVERLPEPFISIEMYVAFSRQFYLREKATAERIWSAIPQLRDADSGKK